MKNEKLKKALNFISGNITSQLIIIIFTPVLTRIYSPEDFGIYAIVNSIILTIGVIFCARYDQLMFTYCQKENWRTCFSNGIKSSIIFSSISFLIVFSFNIFSNIPSYVYLLLIILPSFSISQLCFSIFILENRHSLYIRINILRSILLMSFQFILHKLEYIGLVASLAITQFIILIICFSYCVVVLNYKFRIHTPFKDYKLSLLSSVQSTISAVSSQLPTFFIPYIYTYEILGFYSLAQRLTQLPITFISNAIRPYIMGEINKSINNKINLFPLIKKYTLLLLILSFIGIILISIFSKSFFILYAGNEWSISGDYATILSFWLMISFANIISTSYLNVLGRFKELFIYDSTLLILRIIVIIFSLYFSISIIYFLFFYSILGMLFNFIIIIMSLIISYNTDKKNTI